MYTTLVFAVVLAVANAGVVLQGPSSAAHVVGPDGSQIVASAPGAGVVAEHAAYPYAAHPYAAHAYAAPLAYAAHPYAFYAEGSGIEGQYVHDFTEKLYDDGSYKGEFY